MTDLMVDALDELTEDHRATPRAVETTPLRALMDLVRLWPIHRADWLATVKDAASWRAVREAERESRKAEQELRDAAGWARR